MPLKIAFFTDTFLPNKDGVVKSILLMKKYLEKRSHKVYVFSPSPSGREYVNGDVFYFKSIEFPPYPQYRISFPFLPKVNKIAESLGIDIVHNHGIALTSWASISVSKHLSIPSISTFHTDITKATHYLIENKVFQRFSESIAWSYLRFLYSNFNVITAPSKKSSILLKENGIPSIYLPNGIEISSYGRKRKRGNYILHVGRLVKEKEIDFIFPCLKESKRIKLIVVGKGPAESLYKQKAKSLKLKNIEFLGFVDDRKLVDLYRKAKALVFCSTFDTQGLVVIESLSNGTPVIFRKGTSAEEVAHSLGTSFSDCNSFFESLEKAQKIKEEKCVELSKDFDIRKITKRWELLYNSLKK